MGAFKAFQVSQPNENKGNVVYSFASQLNLVNLDIMELNNTKV